MGIYPMNTTSPVSPKRKSRSLTFELVEQLSAEIQNGSLSHGQKLPTEAAIMERFGVSRTVVREAISKLQAAGLVETRHGIGTFVLEQTDTPVFRTAFKPTATILQRQATVDTAGAATELIGRGRHDPCVVPRAVPIVEAMTALVLLDHWLRHAAQNRTFTF